MRRLASNLGAVNQNETWRVETSANLDDAFSRCSEGLDRRQ
jgi:hypothetical protein